MKAVHLVASAALLVTGWAALAKPAPAPAHGPAGPSAEQIIAARQAGMLLAATSINGMRNAANNGVSPKAMAFPASGLAKWAESMPPMFAENTSAFPSRAKPEVWSDAAGFAAKAAALNDATKALAAATAADDKEAFATALASTAAACKGCHETYQAPPPAPPKAG